MSNITRNCFAQGNWAKQLTVAELVCIFCDMLSNEPTKLNSTESVPLVDFKVYLQQEFLNRCRKNQRYNLSVFARFLNMDVSTLAKILKGQRPIRAKAIRKIGLKLGLNPNQILQFEKASPRANAVHKTDSIDLNYQQLTLDSFQVISDWYHYAILELMQLNHFQNDFNWIAKTLQISTTEAQLAVERLMRLEMIEIDSDGRWKDLSGGRSTTIGNQFTADAFKNHQRQILEKSLIALDEVAFEKRSQTSMTMAIHSKRIPEAKKMIIEFQRKLNKFLGEGERDQLDAVYQLGISLFPLSSEEKTNKKRKKNENDKK